MSPPAGGPGAEYFGRTLFVNGVPVTAARLSVAPSYAELLSESSTNSNNLEFIINGYGTYADIFDYPKGTKEIGRIKNVGGQGCTNVLYGYGSKIIWIVAGPKQIEEFDVPKTPVRILKVDYSFASSCAMNAQGDLAVGILYGKSTDQGEGGGDVVIFNHATGNGKVYSTPLDEEFFDGYDDKGNLFADGFLGDRSDFALVELPKGASKFVEIATSNSPEFPGSVQWDGTYVTVFDQIANATYRYSISGTHATLKSTVSLAGQQDCAQTWLVKGLLYCSAGEIFNYPAGGKPVATFTGRFDEPLGVTAADK